MAGQYVDIDNGGNVVITPPTGKSVIIDGAVRFDSTFRLNGADGADAANALLLGVGTTADPALTAVADKDFIEVRAKSTATSGTGRLAYMRYNLAGAGGSGECIRAFTDLTAAVTTARGAQISLQVGSTGYVSGLGVGVTAQLYVKGSILPANGSYAALEAEIFTEASANPSAVAELSFIRVANKGNSTAMALVDDKAYLFVLEGLVSGAAHLWYDNQKAAPAVEEFLRVKTPSGDRFLGLYNANA